MSLRPLLLALLACGTAHAQLAPPCDRACMTRLVDQYLAAMVKHDPSGLPLARGVRYTENTAEIQVGEGLWVGATEAPTTGTEVSILPRHAARLSTGDSRPSSSAVAGAYLREAVSPEAAEPFGTSPRIAAHPIRCSPPGCSRIAAELWICRRRCDGRHREPVPGLRHSD